MTALSAPLIASWPPRHDAAILAEELPWCVVVGPAHAARIQVRCRYRQDARHIAESWIGGRVACVPGVVGVVVDLGEEAVHIAAEG